jgi:hypothetical protein
MKFGEFRGSQKKADHSFRFAPNENGCIGAPETETFKFN